MIPVVNTWAGDVFASYTGLSQDFKKVGTYNRESLKITWMKDCGLTDNEKKVCEQRLGAGWVGVTIYSECYPKDEAWEKCPCDDE